MHIQQTRLLGLMRPKRLKSQRIQYALPAKPTFLTIKYCSVRAPCSLRGMMIHIQVLVMRPCSHVICKVCTDALVRPASQCIVCDRGLTDLDMVELKREGMYAWSAILSRNHGLPSFICVNFVLSGTGFAGGGLAETTKKGVAFQG